MDGVKSEKAIKRNNTHALGCKACGKKGFYTALDCEHSSKSVSNLFTKQVVFFVFNGINMLKSYVGLKS